MRRRKNKAAALCWLLKMAMFEPVSFVNTFLSKKLDFAKTKDTVTVHVPCSSKKMKIEADFVGAASMCDAVGIADGMPGARPQS